MEHINNLTKEILENEDLSQKFEKVGEDLMESIFTTMQSRSRESKINAAVAAISISIAKKKQDPLYPKLIKFKKLWKSTKDQIVQKYGPMAHQKWVENQAKKK